jgi:histidyl-tRNA synthetase
MIGIFSGKEIPATGISFGIERIIEVMKERKMLENIKNKTKVFVVSVNDKVRDKVLEIVQKLREKSIATEYDLRFRSLSRQLEYVNSLGIPFAIIVGEKELEKKSVKIRDMKTGKEELVKINEITADNF